MRYIEPPQELLERYSELYTQIDGGGEVTDDNGMKYTKEYIAKVRLCSNLIDPPASDVIGELLDEIEQLTAELAELKADAERLAKSFVIEIYPHEWVCRSGCHHMGKTPDTIEHAPNCPITLHRQLVAKYGGEK